VPERVRPQSSQQTRSLLRILRDVQDAELHQLGTVVPEHLARVLVRGDVAPFLVGDDHRRGSVLDRVAEEDALDVGLGDAHRCKLTF
jgi:hypothetical protein